MKQPVIVIATRSKQPPPRSEWPLDSSTVNWVCGHSDVTLARNVQLSLALQLAHRWEADSVVLLDDDIRISAEQLELLVSACKPGQPTTLLYCCRGEPERLPVTIFDDLIVSGLGACAIAVSDLKLLADSSPLDLSRMMYGFTESTMHQANGEAFWLSEDYCFWKNLKLLAEAELLVLNERVVHLSDTGEPLLPIDGASGTRIARKVLGVSLADSISEICESCGFMHDYLNYCPKCEAPTKRGFAKREHL
jgi:hypothetical protein